MRALVTGASGFVGSRLTWALAEAGHPTTALVRETSNLDQLASVQERVSVLRTDGTYKSLLEAVQTSNPDVVFHTATYFVVQHTPEDAEKLIRSNVLFPCLLVEAMVQAGVRYLVNTGTSWQHFETDGYVPVCLHSATKQAFEDLLLFYASSQRLSSITLKLYDTYGPNDPRPKVFNFLLNQLVRTEPLAMSPGEQEIDLVHVDDVVSAYLKAAELLVSGQTAGAASYAVSSGSPMPLRRIVESFETTFGRKLNLHWGGRPYRERDVMTSWRGGAVLPGWEPRIDLASGFRKMAEYHRDRERHS
jgi:nucleoside-diphosphate-sugar epimerase